MVAKLFTYDLASNRLTRTYTGPSEEYETTYVYDANDRLLNETLVDANTSSNDRYTEYGYDNTVQTDKTVYQGQDDQGTVLEEYTYGYDATGRMTSVTIDTPGSNTTTTYAYNNQGLRISETSGGTTTTYLFDMQNPTGYAQVLEEWKDSGGGATLSKTYTVGLDVIAQHDATNGVLAFVYDAMGSTRGLTDSDGELADAGGSGIKVLNFDALGRAVGFVVADALTSLLRHGEWTTADGRQYLRARWEQDGRFFTKDPFPGILAGPLTLHSFLSFHANAIMNRDSSGMSPTIEFSASTAIRLNLMAQVLPAVAALTFTALAATAILTSILPSLTSSIALPAPSLPGINLPSPQQIGQLVLSRLNAAIKALRSAAGLAAAATGIAVTTLTRMPVFFVPEIVMPHIYNHTVTTLTFRPNWFVLTYNGGNTTLTNANRAAALAGKQGLLVPALGLNSLDEYPYASTLQGGAQSAVAAVPLLENAAQGGYLSWFYQQALNGQSRSFLVVPIPR